MVSALISMNEPGQKHGVQTRLSGAPQLFFCALRPQMRLSALLEAVGFDPVFVQPGQLLGQFASGDINLAVIDCRDSFEVGLAAIAAIAEQVRLRDGAVLALLSKSSVDDLPRIFRAGATHFLMAPFADIELTETLRFMLRHRTRVADASALRTVLTPSPRLDAYNGLASEERLREWMTQIEPNHPADMVAVMLLIGVSRIDRVNASFGRRVADGVLRAIAKRLQRLVDQFTSNEDDPVRIQLARLGGAEFAAVMLGDRNLIEGVRLGKLICAMFVRPFIVDGHVIHMACRIGIAISDTLPPDADILFLRSSHALAVARTMEPNSYVIHETDLPSAPLQSINLEHDLRAAIVSERLTLAYQPQVCIATHNILGFEALVRWEHPTLGPVRPETLITVAEEAEFIMSFGTSILRRALNEARMWENKLVHQARLAVNIAAAQLQYGGLDVIIREALAESDFNPNHLTLEITETTFIKQMESALLVVEQLRALGVRVAIDDFGTGHASYAQLRALPFDYLKIDQSFIKNIVEDSRDRALVRSMIDMAQSVNMQVIAEGVESEAQLDILVQDHCTAWQGFLCSEAVPAGQIAPLVERWNKSFLSHEA